MKKNILVVEDSALMRRVICDIINSDDNFQATDTCKDGLEAYERLKQKSYDGVLLDIIMPKMDGIQVLEKLQKERIRATVIVVSTATSTGDAEVTLQALELGAVDFVPKPGNIIEAKGDSFKKRLLAVMAAVFHVRLSANSGEATVPRRPLRTAATVPDGNSASARAAALSVAPSAARPTAPVRHLPATGSKRIIALACSTGGPKSLQSVIPYLPKNIDAPIVLVQHMPVGFTKSMADRLNDVSKVSVKEAEDGDCLEKGHVYVAPGGKHLEVKRNTDGTHRIALNDMPPIGGLKPCANVMYDSLCDSGFDEVVCVVLTGMGADGTKGILTLSRKKPIYVIAQDEKTCVVYGMPKAVADAGLTDQVVPLQEVANAITKKVGVR